MVDFRGRFDRWITKNPAEAGFSCLTSCRTFLPSFRLSASFEGSKSQLGTRLRPVLSGKWRGWLWCCPAKGTQVGIPRWGASRRCRGVAILPRLRRLFVPAPPHGCRLLARVRGIPSAGSCPYSQQPCGACLSRLSVPNCAASASWDSLSAFTSSALGPADFCGKLRRIPLISVSFNGIPARNKSLPVFPGCQDVRISSVLNHKHP